jgi:predicted PurR-regulated permease PerM
MSEKKVVKREIAVALGAVCIVLAISMVGAVLYQYSIYNNLQSSYNTLQSNYNDLQSSQSANSAYINDHSHTNEEYESLKSTLTSTQSQLSSTQSQLSSANAIANLQSSSTWLSSATVNQDRGSYYSYTYSAGYALVMFPYIFNRQQLLISMWKRYGLQME